MSASSCSSEESLPFVQPASYRSSDPSARAVLRLLRGSPEIDLRLVHEACANRLGLAAAAIEAEKRAMAVRSLRASRGDLGLAPSKSSYETWRLELPRESWLMSASAIARAFGSSWPKAVSAAGGTPKVDLIAARSMSAGPRFTPGGLVQGLQDAAAYYQQDWLTFPLYTEWARRDMASDPSKIHALSRDAFSRRGGFVALAIEAGLEPKRRSSESAATFALPKEGGYQRSDHIRAVQAAHAELVEAADRGDLEVLGLEQPGVDERRLTYRRYATMRADGHAKGPDVWPSVSAVTKQFGNWSSALHAAGLVEDGDHAAGVYKKNRPVDVDRAFRQLREVLDEAGNLTGQAYTARRANAEPPADGGRPMPSYGWFKLKCGTFSNAKRIAWELDVSDEAVEPRAGCEDER